MSKYAKGFNKSFNVLKHDCDLCGCVIINKTYRDDDKIKTRCLSCSKEAAQAQPISDKHDREVVRHIMKVMKYLCKARPKMKQQIINMCSGRTMDVQSTNNAIDVCINYGYVREEAEGRRLRMTPLGYKFYISSQYAKK